MQFGSQKMYIYSAHDSTIAVLAQYFESQDHTWPPFASNLIIEVWESDEHEQDVVRIFHNGKPIGSTQLKSEFITSANRSRKRAHLCDPSWES